MTARAHIVYGFPFAGDSCSDVFKDDESYDVYREDSDEWLCKMQGVVCENWETSSKLPLSIESEGDMCSGAVTEYLCIREATIRGDWDEGTEIPLDHIRQMDSWDNIFKEFCEKAGMLVQQPKWFLIASVG